jgi:predicted dehydrogenase
VLSNQCPHNLDLVQWICGMPSSVSAHIALGKHHEIEVEDEVGWHSHGRSCTPT